MGLFYYLRGERRKALLTGGAYKILGHAQAWSLILILHPGLKRLENILTNKLTRIVIFSMVDTIKSRF